MKTNTALREAKPEVELKLTIAPGDIERLRSHPLLEQYAIAEPRTEELHSTYYDTPDFTIKKHGASLRVRQLDNGCVQTLKEDGIDIGGLFERREWEAHGEGESLDLPTLLEAVGKYTRWGKLLRSPALAQIHPIFETRVSRTIWELQLPGGNEIEFALDEGNIEHELQYQPISEVELELKSGEPAKIFDFARRLTETVPMGIAEKSKSEGGYALVAATPKKPAIVKASTLHLSGKMSIESGFQAILADCIAHIQGNAAGVMQGEELEHVHQMRVGLQRLRSAIRLFEDVIACPESVSTEIDWLVAELGPVRDWDVLSSATLPQIGKMMPANVGVTRLEIAAIEMARTTCSMAGEAVKSVRYTQLILALSAWLQEAERPRKPMASTSRKPAMSLRQFADKKLGQTQGRLLKRGRGLREADAPARHRVRMATKRMRYATEFFQSLYAPARVEKYVDVLSGIQDELGWLNDAAVADGLLLDLEKDRHELAISIGFARGYLLSAVQHPNPVLQQLWQRVKAFRMPPQHRGR